MIVYSKVSYKPKKKRKPKGQIARKINVSKLHGEKIPSYTYGLRVGSNDAKSVKSLVTDAQCMEKKESLKYTGTLVKGIATMHKSNAVPVIDEEQMKDISRMRR